MHNTDLKWVIWIPSRYASVLGLVATVCITFLDKGKNVSLFVENMRQARLILKFIPIFLGETYEKCVHVHAQLRLKLQLNGKNVELNIHPLSLSKRFRYISFSDTIIVLMFNHLSATTKSINNLLLHVKHIDTFRLICERPNDDILVGMIHKPKDVLPILIQDNPYYPYDALSVEELNQLVRTYASIPG